MHVVITGGTGLIGTRLTQALLGAGHLVTVLSRKAQESQTPGLVYTAWDGKRFPDGLPNVDAIVNLAGAGIADKPWTAAYKKVIIDSRLATTKACVTYIQQAAYKPQVFLSGSAVGYYGTASKDVLPETAPAGNDFLGIVGKQWEAAAAGAGIRTALLRTGIVLAHEGGAFPKLLAPFKFYAGGHIASGKQGFPWIHIEDEVGIILFLINHSQAEGPFNLVAPEVLDNAGFGHKVGNALHKPSGLPVPAFAVKMLLGESHVIVTEGQFVSAKKVKDAGYEFKYPTAEAALQELLSH